MLQIFHGPSLNPASSRNHSSDLFLYHILIYQGFPSGLAVKNLPTVQETQVQFLGQEDPLMEGMATQLQYSCLGKSHGQRIVAVYGPRDRKESDMTEETEQQQYPDLLP